MRRNFKSSVTAALAAALVFSSIGFNSAEARSRHHHRDNAAALAAVATVFGVIAAAAAADSYRERHYYYSDGPHYYGPSYGYAPPVYRHRHRHAPAHNPAGDR